MSKKLLTLIGIVILSISLLAGCGVKEEAMVEKTPTEDVVPTAVDVNENMPATTETKATESEPTTTVEVKTDTKVAPIKPVTPAAPIVVPTPTPTPTPTPDPVPPPVVQPQTQNFVISASKFEFSPSTITVNKGDIVNITVKSSDVDHGIAIPAFGVSKTIDAGGSATVKFVADKEGTFEFFCSVFCGSGHSTMTGKLIVK